MLNFFSSSLTVSGSVNPFSPLSRFPAFSHFSRASTLLTHCSRLLVLLVASLLLSGCVDSDLGIRFDSPNRGEIVQHIQLGDTFTRLSGTTAQQWFNAIEQRSRALGGQTKRLPDQSLVVTLPFSTAAELETKFNRFFSLEEDGRSAPVAIAAELPAIASHLTVSQSNLLLLERYRLTYDLDLRSLGVLSSSGNLLLSPGALVALEFRLETPWGVRNAAKSLAGQKQGRAIVWQLVPGEVNHIESLFWLPSPLGLGTLLIGLLVAAGYFLKYPRLPSAIPPKRQAIV